MDDLILTYKAKVAVLLTEAEIVNNTPDGLIESDLLIERIAKAMKDLGAFDDLYHPDRV